MANRLRLNKPSSAQDGSVTARFLSDEERPSVSDPTGKALSAHTWKQLVLNTWLPEIVAMVFSAACLLAVAIVLRAYDGQPSPQLRWNLTLNAVISILATASKTALLAVVAASISQLKWCWFATSRKLQDMQSFDDASRGILGSVYMLLCLPTKHLASIGALITVLALAFDPFLQQIVRYPSRQVSIPSATASARKASTFFLPGIGQSQYLSEATADDIETLQYVGAINAGIWSDASQFVHEPTCPSGNCTWPSFQSVGWCSKCSNATSSIVLSEDCISTIQPWTTENVTCSLSLGQGNNVTIFQSVNTSSGPGYWTSPPVVWVVHSTDQPFSASDAGKPVADTQYYDGKPLNDTEYLGIKNPLMVFGFAYVNFNYNHSAKNYTEVLTPIGFNPRYAEQCVLTPCLREYEVSTTGGVSVINVTDINYGSVEYWSRQGSPYTEVCWQAEGGETTWNEAGPCTSSTTETEDYCEQAGNASWPAFCPVGVYQEALSQRLTDKTFFNVSSHGYGEGYYTNGSIDRNTTQWEFSAQRFSDLMQVINASTLGNLMDNVAASLTSLGLDVSNETVTGSIALPQVYVVANWEWLILPVVLEIAGIALLLATALMSKHRKVSLWKTSTLALFYHGLEEKTLHNRDVAQDVCGMGLSARKTVVKLATSDGDGRVVLKETSDDGHAYVKVGTTDAESAVTSVQ